MERLHVEVEQCQLNKHGEAMRRQRGGKACPDSVVVLSDGLGSGSRQISCHH